MFTCTYISWFQFKEKCSITTCKYHSLVLPTCCLALHHRQSSAKPFTDEELHYYKFDHSAEDLKSVSLKRKKALVNARLILALHSYLQYLVQTIDLTNKKYKLPENWEISSALLRFVESLPLSLAKDKHLPFRIEMLPFLLDSELYEDYLTTIEGEAKEYSLSDILMQTPSRFQNLCSELSMLQNYKALSL